ncbi:MAG: NAD(P)H-binding protein [Myxococcales bacterium]
MNERIAIVAGGTGLVGNELVEELLARSDWTKVVLVGRRKSGRQHAKLEERVVELAALSSQALPRAEAAFCCLGTTIKKAGSQQAFRAVDLDAVVSFAKAVKAAGTERFFVVTATGADARSRIFYNRVKGEAEDALRQVGFASLGIARPSLLLGDRAESRPGERVAVVLSRALKPLLAPLAARPIEARTVAKALLSMAGNPPPGARIYSNAELHQLGS